MEIRNLANYRIQVGDKSIAPNASVSMPYDDYLSIAMGNDLSALPISVSAYESGLRHASVADFGAKGDGIADDTLAIQSAIDYVEGFGGGVVELFNRVECRSSIGVYVVTRIVVSGNVSLEGQSKEHTVLKQKAGEDSAILSVSGSRSGIYRMTLRGNHG